MRFLHESALSRKELLVRVGKLTLFGRLAIAMPPDQRADSVIVQAGRRVDAINAETARFPSANVSVVKERIKARFLQDKPAALVTSAACGTDLIVLETAQEMKVECFILLPSPPSAFRASSVADRPGNWGTLFDQVTKRANLEVLKLPEGQEGYLETNLRLLDKAQAIARKRHLEVIAMVVWDQKSRGADDVTGHFLEQARIRHLAIIEIPTL